MTVEDFLDYVKKSKSKNTYKEYKRGIAKFCEWYGKSADEVLEDMSVQSHTPIEVSSTNHKSVNHSPLDGE